jgi:hypothetical protein
MHIPRGSKLDIDECKRSMEQAKEFFATYFPEFEYNHFVCWSWLLDDTLKKYLPAESGILQLASLFEPVEKTPSYALLKYIFAWDTTPLNLRYRYPVTSLAAAVQKAVLAGETFYEVLGVIRK